MLRFVLYGIAFVSLSTLMYLVPLAGFSSDQSTFWAWASKLASSSMNSFYEPNYFCDYFPSYLYVLKLQGLLASLFDISFQSYAGKALLKLPAIISLIAMAYFASKWSQEEASTTDASGKWQPNWLNVVVFALFALNPALMYNAVGFGQVDVTFCLLTLVLIRLCFEDSPIKTAAVYAVLLSFKPQALFLLPFLFLIALRFRWWLPSARSWKAVGIFILLTVVLHVPFWIGHFEEMLPQYAKTFTSYNYMTLNAFSYYSALGMNWKPMDAGVLGTNPYVIFSVISLVVLGAVIVKVWKRFGSNWKNVLDDEFCSLLGVVAVFLCVYFGPKMHERYLIVGFPFFAFLMRSNKLVLFSFLMLSVLNAINQAVVVDHYFGSKQAIGGPVLLLGSVGVGLCILLIFNALWDKVSQSPLDDRIPLKQSEWSRGGTLSMGNRFVIGQRDWLALAIITCIALFQGLHNLGDKRFPSSGIQDSGTYRVSFPVDSKPVKLWIMAKDIKGRINYTCANGTHVTYNFSGTSYNAWSKSKVPKACFNEFDIEIKLTKKGKVMELAFEDAQKQIITPESVCIAGSCSVAEKTPLFDEPYTTENRGFFMSSAYFDEIYYSRAIDDLKLGDFPYENTHPPMGKFAVAALTEVIGYSPWSWRLLFVICSGLFPLILFFIGREVFSSRVAAYLASILCLADFLRISLSRIFTIDVLVTFFILLAYLFLFKHARHVFEMKNQTKSFKEKWKILILAAVFLGCALSVKWVAVFTLGACCSVVGVLILWQHFSGLSKTVRVEWSRLFGDIATSIAICIGLPLFIYWLSFTPFYYYLNNGFSVDEFFRTQKHMYSYHANLKATHPFSSVFYTWPFIQKPLWAVIYNSPDGMRSSISFFGNPLVWWVILPSVIYCVTSSLKKIHVGALLVMTAFGFQFLPWVTASRITFIYHFLGSSLMGILLVSYVLSLGWKHKHLKIAICAYAICAIGILALYWPVVTGLPVSSNFDLESIKLFSTWSF